MFKKIKKPPSIFLLLSSFSCLFFSLILAGCFSPLKNEYNKKVILTLTSDHHFFSSIPKGINATNTNSTNNTATQQNAEIEKKKNNVMFSNGNFYYENFYDVSNDTLAMFNRNKQHIAFGKSSSLKMYSAPWVNSVIGVIANDDKMVAITYTFNGTLGLVVLEEIEKKMQFKSIYPFYRTDKKLSTVKQNITTGRMRQYADDVFNIKIDYNTIVRVSKERFARWHKISNKDLEKVKGDYLYQDLIFSNSPENAILIFKEKNFDNKTTLIFAEYSLESKKILSTKSIKINSGIYFSTTIKDEVITTHYDNKKLAYIFTYYSITTGEKIKTHSFSTSKEIYPRNFVYNGKQLHGFHHNSNSIAISIWEE